MKQERPIEDYRAAVIALKKQYKNLAEEYQSTQNEIKKMELQTKPRDMYDQVRRAQKLNKNVVRMQSVIKGGFWRKKVRKMREKRANLNKQLTYQEKYMEYVTSEGYELEGAIKEVAKKFQDSYGLSMPMIFRILDKKGQGSILTDDFERFLMKYVDLPSESKSVQNELCITPDKIKTVLKGLDKNKSGYLSSERYLLVLERLGLSEGLTQSVYKKTQLNIYVERALQNICDRCEFHGVTPEQLFRQLASKNPQYMSKHAFYEWLEQPEVQIGQLSSDEKMALNIVFNLDHTLFIKKIDFLARILPVVRKTITQQQLSARNSLVANSSLSNLNLMGRISQVSFEKSTPHNLSKTMQDGDQIQQIIEKMFANKPLHSFLEMVLLTINSQKTFLTTDDLSYHLDQYLGENTVTYREKGLVFRAIDMDGNGNIEMDELVTFFVQMSKKIQLSMNTFLIMQAKMLEVEGHETRQHFADIGLDERKQEKIDVATFNQTFGASLGLDEQNLNRLFMEIDKKQEGKVSIKELIQIIDGYRSDGSSLLKKNQEDNLVQKKIKQIEDLKIQLEIKAKLTTQKLWARVDTEEKGYVTLYELKTAISKALPNFKNSELIDILQYIDVNDNSIIDKQEFELAFMHTTHDLNKDRKSQSKIPSAKQITEAPVVENKEEMIQILKNALLQNGLTPMKFFEQADVDKSGDISLVELKVILAYLKIDLAIVLKLMKIFDKNIDGTISYEEFVSEVGQTIEPSRPLKKINSLIQVKKENIDDERAAHDIRSKLHEFGDEQPYELKEALLKLGKFLMSRTQKYSGDQKKAYEELFKEFDINTDMVLSRAEFIQGLDLYQDELGLTDRQKIRLMLTADSNKDNRIDMNEFIQFITNSVYKIEAQDSESEKEKRISKFKEKLKQTGMFAVDDAAQKELMEDKMSQYLVKNMQDLLEKKQLENEDVSSIIDKESLQEKIQQILKLASLEKVEEKYSVNSLRQIFIYNTFQFQLSQDEIDALMQAFSDEFQGKVIELNLPKKQQPSSKQASRPNLDEVDDNDD